MDNYRNAAHGLTGEEANKRLEIHGRNVLKPAKRHGWLKILFSQFTDLMIIILIASSIISFTMGENSEGIAILAIILLNGLLGFIQEMRTEKAMEALIGLAAPMPEWSGMGLYGIFLPKRWYQEI